MFKRIPLLIAAFAAVAAFVPAAASAKVVEVGQTKTPIAAPSCPKGVALTNCRIVLAHTTAIQTTSDGVANPMRVKQAGWITAFSVGLSNLVNNAKTERSLLHGLDSSWGGTPQLALTVLRPSAKNSYRVVAQSGSYHLIPFLGKVIQQPLSMPPKFSTFTALPVKKGDVIGLTVPTWAPILTYNLTAKQFGYRQSRTRNCQSPPKSQTAQTKVGASQRYLCSYTGTRVQYTVTEVTNTPYPKKYVH